MFTTINECIGNNFSMLVYGESGAGKTSLTKTLPCDPSRVLFVNAENGGLSIKDSGVAVYDLTKEKSGDSIIELNRTERFHKLARFMTEIGQHKDEYDWIVIDSLTEISQNLVEGLKIEHAGDNYAVWGNYTEKLISMIKTFRDIYHFNVVFLALDTVTQDEAGQRFMDINIQGKKAAEAIPAQFDFVFYLKKYEDNEGNEQRSLVTSSYKNIKAKDRSDKLDQFEPADISKIVEKINA